MVKNCQNGQKWQNGQQSSTIVKNGKNSPKKTKEWPNMAKPLDANNS